MATGTEVAVVKMNKPVSFVDPKNMKKDVAKRYLARAAGPKSPFIGNQIRANGQDGEFAIGYGAGGKKKEEIRYVVNVPQTLAVWQYWPEGEAPSYPFICTVFGEDQLPNRSGCGPEETKPNKMKKLPGGLFAQEDVWKEGMILILRDPKTNELAHMEAFNNVHKRAAEFVLGLADAPELEKGMLPVVEMFFEKVKLKDGGSFQGVMFEVVEWVKAQKIDMPQGIEAAVSKAAEDAEADAEAEESLERAEAEAAAKKRKARAAAAVEEDEPAPRSRRATASAEPSSRKRAAAVEVDADDEDEPDPRQGNGKTRDSRNNPPAELDDEDDKPVVRSRRATAEAVEPAPTTRKRAAAPVEDEDDEPVRPARRRAAVH